MSSHRAHPTEPSLVEGAPSRLRMRRQVATLETPAELDFDLLPRHVAIIMDGNGRWAERRGLPRPAGHKAGVRPVRGLVEASVGIGLRALTLYAFSSENWKRPALEISSLMRLLRRTLRKNVEDFRTAGIRFRMIGVRSGLPDPVLREIENAEAETADGRGLNLNLAINYGGRQEIVETVRRLAAEVASGQRTAESIDERAIAHGLDTAASPELDLMIRTGGESRISNFLLWQVAYAEIHITRTLWPDFGEQEFYRALLEFQRRERRFGGLGDEANPGTPARKGGEVDERDRVPILLPAPGVL